MPTEYGNGGALGGVVGAVAGINVLRSILPSGVADGAGWRSGDLENPQAAVRVINHRGDVEIFVHRHTSWETTWRGGRGYTSGRNWTAE